MPGTWIFDSALVPLVIKILPTATCHIAIEIAVSWQLLRATTLFLNTSPPTNDSENILLRTFLLRRLMSCRYAMLSLVQFIFFILASF